MTQWRVALKLQRLLKIIIGLSMICIMCESQTCSPLQGDQTHHQTFGVSSDILTATAGTGYLQQHSSVPQLGCPQHNCLGRLFLSARRGLPHKHRCRGSLLL